MRRKVHHAVNSSNTHPQPIHTHPHTPTLSFFLTHTRAQLAQSQRQKIKIENAPHVPRNEPSKNEYPVASRSNLLQQQQQQQQHKELVSTSGRQ